MNNNIYQNWHQGLLDQENFSNYAEQCYQTHKNKGNADYTFVGNFPECNAELLQTLNFTKIGLFKKTAIVAGGIEIPKLGDLNDAYIENVLDAAVLDDDHSLTKYLKDRFDLETIFISVNRQCPNHLVGLHKDTNKSLIIKHQEDFLISKLRKYIVFVSPWSEGQVFMIGQSACTNWQVGDVISFEWYMPHATANASWHDRYILFVSGVAN